MSANPRSPESGEPIYLAGQGYVQRDGMWQQLTVYPSPVDRTASDALDMISRLTAELSTARERADRAEQPHPLVEWNPSHGTVLWWAFHDGMPYEPPYVGTPLDSDWPGYHSHWTRIHAPTLSTPTPTPDHA